MFMKSCVMILVYSLHDFDVIGIVKDIPHYTYILNLGHYIDEMNILEYSIKENIHDTIDRPKT